MVIAAEKALHDTKEHIKARKRESRLATHLQEQKDIQEHIRQLEQKQRRQRADIFNAV